MPHMTSVFASNRPWRSATVEAGLEATVVSVRGCDAVRERVEERIELKARYRLLALSFVSARVAPERLERPGAH
jgi:hypothetical protein